MLRSLRARLLASYLGIIAIVLLMVTFALLGFATVSTVRYVPALQELSAISLNNQYELLQLVDAGASAEQLEQFFEVSADAYGVRILVTEASSRQIIYDTGDTASWVGVVVDDVSRPQRTALNVAADSIFGRYQHPNGTSWLVYAQPTGAFSRSLIFYAQPEPTPTAFFSAFFLRPLLSAGVLATVIAVLLAFGITQSVVKPLRRMARAAEAIAGGDYNQQVDVDGPDEIQRVATSFNSMVWQVKQTQQAQQDFVANVSHDLKTPLTIVQGWSQALLDGTADSAEERDQAATVIHEESERMGRMVAQLLDLARLESGTLALSLQPVALTPLLRDVVYAMQPTATSAEIDLQFHADAHPIVQGDSDRLTQIFTNLIGNGIAYTTRPGRVMVALTVAPGAQAIVRVQDSGPGISAEELPRVFERFYRVDKSRQRRSNSQGSGLGLAIVKELVEAHGGRISAESVAGESTAFVVRLPLSSYANSAEGGLI